MQIDLTYLRRHYASLSDEGLLEVDETELVDEARRIYDEELEQRGLTLEESAEDDAEWEEDAEEIDKPDWLSDAGISATFVARPGVATPPDSAMDAADALSAAGIPHHVSRSKVDDEPESVSPVTTYEFRVMVPGKRNFEAQSVLDRDIFNREIEAEWKTYFEVLSDDELRAADLEVLLAGLKDRIERITRAYEEELSRRQ